MARAQFILHLGGLFIRTGEFAATGLLRDFVRSVDVSFPEAGHLISAYGLDLVVGSPVLAVTTASALSASTFATAVSSRRARCAPERSRPDLITRTKAMNTIDDHAIADGRLISPPDLGPEWN
ncbi:hypothetical protein SAMN05216337_101561 [Bradyrhizobium brasilense]|uniref:Uncharacterized protein n=1 Tax=Bradyrhizobium brasilense TaxID=1419277 RepID=A0A1G6XLN4_9BRAD|nr:hypothetical protein [Bradyrhizobium brasilense]SDD78345.1 hypothetical protein SAMN05216337_101561 [Bradyrhizobium brasilense]